MLNFSGKNILITGATGGIGKDTCIYLNKLGANVIISGRNEEKLSELSGELNNAPYIVYDMNASLDECEEKANSFIQEAITLTNNNLDGLVCISGMTADKLAMKMNIEEWHNVINVNLTAVFLLNKFASIAMRKKRKGSIVNITSIVGHTGNFGQANYTASKGGLTAMSKTFALEYAGSNIRNNCIAPGFIKTQMTDKIPEKNAEAILNKIPMKKMGLPKDISPSIAFLLSDESSYITGQTIHVNGGMYM